MLVRLAGLRLRALSEALSEALRTFRCSVRLKAKARDSLSSHLRRGGPLTETTRWYNPARRVVEEVPASMSDAQAIELLSGHLGSEEFIEEYRRWRATQSDVVRALILTGGAFYVEHERGQPPN